MTAWLRPVILFAWLGTTQLLLAEMDLPKLAANVRPSVGLVVVYDASGTEIATGSGFFITANELVTNNHVVDGATSIKIKMEGGAVWDSLGVLAADANKDIAILRINTSNAPPLPLSKAASVDPGTHVAVIGSPLGLEGTISDGIVSGIRLTSNGPLLQITAPISHGSSGSPVLNENGEVVGVASSNLEGGQSLNFAVSSSTVQSMLSTITPQTTLAKYPNSAADQAVQLNRDPAYQQAMRLMDQGSYNDALQIFKKLTETYPKAAEVYYQVGYIFDRSKMWDEAIDAYSQAAQLNPDSPDIWGELGKTLTRAGKSKEASSALEHAVKLAPDNAALWDALGCAYGNSGDHKHEAAAFVRALALAPEPTDRLYALLSGALSSLGQQQDAAGQYSAALESYKNSITVCNTARQRYPQWSAPVTQIAVDYSLIALTLQKTGAGTTAETWMQDALQTAPSDEQVLWNAGTYYYKGGNADRYRQVLSSLAAVNPSFASTLDNSLRSH